MSAEKSPPELFPAAAVQIDSPRLKWQKQYNLSVGQLPDGTKFCVGRTFTGYGDTMLEAEEDWASAEEVEHWNVTEFKKAGVKMPEPAADFEF